MSPCLSYRRTAPASLITLTAILLLAACASAGHPRDASTCRLRGNDSTFIAARPLYRDCAVDERAQLLTNDIRPDFQPRVSLGTACYSADLEFVVDTAGIPELGAARIARSTNQQYAEAVLATLPRWRYQAARLQGHPVRQLVVEHRAIMTSTAVVVVPAGSGPPARPPAGPAPHAPAC